MGSICLTSQTGIGVLLGLGQDTSGLVVDRRDLTLHGGHTASQGGVVISMLGDLGVHILLDGVLTNLTNLRSDLGIRSSTGSISRTGNGLILGSGDRTSDSGRGHRIGDAIASQGGSLVSLTINLGLQSSSQVGLAHFIQSSQGASVGHLGDGMGMDGVGLGAQLGVHILLQSLTAFHSTHGSGDLLIGSSASSSDGIRLSLVRIIFGLLQNTSAGIGQFPNLGIGVGLCRSQSGAILGVCIGLGSLQCISLGLIGITLEFGLRTRNGGIHIGLQSIVAQIDVEAQLDPLGAVIDVLLVADLVHITSLHASDRLTVDDDIGAIVAVGSTLEVESTRDQAIHSFLVVVVGAQVGGQIVDLLHQTGSSIAHSGLQSIDLALSSGHLAFQLIHRLGQTIGGAGVERLPLDGAVSTNSRIHAGLGILDTLQSDSALGAHHDRLVVAHRSGANSLQSLVGLDDVHGGLATLDDNQVHTIEVGTIGATDFHSSSGGFLSSTQSIKVVTGINREAASRIETYGEVKFTKFSHLYIPPLNP